MEKFKLGQKVWAATGRMREKLIQCPHCFGKMFLTLIMGDGTQHTIDCDCCRNGYEGSKGYLKTYEREVLVEEGTISKVEETLEKIEYRFNGNYCGDEYFLFLTKEEAEARSLILCEEYKQEEIRRIGIKEKMERSWAWNARYHRDNIKNLQKQLDYHKSKLEVASVKAKEKII